SSRAARWVRSQRGRCSSLLRCLYWMTVPTTTSFCLPRLWIVMAKDAEVASLLQPSWGRVTALLGAQLGQVAGTMIEAQTRMVARWLRWWRGIACAGLLVSLAHRGQAADFTCTAGDVACLITAITTANANGEANTITLDVGVYTIGTVDNDTDGPNG